MTEVPRKIALPITQEALHAFLENLSKVLAHQVNYGSIFGTTPQNQPPDCNMDCWMVSGTSPVGPNTEFSINHNLLRIPIFFLQICGDANDNLYSFYPGMTPWTKATSAGNDGKIYVKSNQNNTPYRVIIF